MVLDLGSESKFRTDVLLGLTTQIDVPRGFQKNPLQANLTAVIGNKTNSVVLPSSTLSEENRKSC